MMEFIKNNLFWEIPVLVVILLAIIFLVVLLLRKPKKKKAELIKVDQGQWLEAMGGRANIIEASAVGSRLSVKLADKSLLNKERIKELGIKNILEMSGKIILVVENNAEHILEELNKNSGI